MKQSYDFILFDWDGCLAKTLDVILDIYRSVFLEFGLERTDEELISIWGDWRGPLKIGISESELPLWVAKYKKALNEKTPFVDLYDGALPMLQNLHANGKHLALLSSSSQLAVEPAVNRTGVRPFFDILLFAEDVTNHKPDPEVVEKAMSILGATKEKTIIVGDSKSDLGAAKNAGIDSLLYYPKNNEKFYTRESLIKYDPSYVVSDFNQIAPIIF